MSGNGSVQTFSTPELANLSVRQTVAHRELLAGSTDVFTITAANAGPSVTPATVTEHFNDLRPLSARTGGGGACSITGSFVRCNLSSLAPSVAPVKITVIARGLQPGVHSPTATISGPSPDPTQSDNSAAAIVDIVSIKQVEVVGVNLGRGDTAALRVHVPGAGVAHAFETAHGKLVAHVSRTASRRGTITLRLITGASERRALRAGPQTATVRVTFTAVAGTHELRDEPEPVVLPKL